MANAAWSLTSAFTVEIEPPDWPVVVAALDGVLRRYVPRCKQILFPAEATTIRDAEMLCWVLNGAALFLEQCFVCTPTAPHRFDRHRLTLWILEDDARDDRMLTVGLAPLPDDIASKAKFDPATVDVPRDRRVVPSDAPGVIEVTTVPLRNSSRSASTTSSTVPSADWHWRRGSPARGTSHAGPGLSLRSGASPTLNRTSGPFSPSSSTEARTTRLHPYRRARTAGNRSNCSPRPPCSPVVWWCAARAGRPCPRCPLRRGSSGS